MIRASTHFFRCADMENGAETKGLQISKQRSSHSNQPGSQPASYQSLLAVCNVGLWGRLGLEPPFSEFPTLCLSPSLPRASVRHARARARRQWKGIFPWITTRSAPADKEGRRDSRALRRWRPRATWKAAALTKNVDGPKRLSRAAAALPLIAAGMTEIGS